MMSSFEDYDILQKNLIGAIELKKDNTKNFLELRWSNKAAIARANQIFSVLGSASTLDQRKEGFIIWKNVDPFFRYANSKASNVYSKIIIKDEHIPHLIPVPHTDWFYAYIHLDIPNNLISDVLALTESIGYDSMSREIYARCHFMPANLTSLFLVKQIVNGHKSLVHALQEYSILIPILAKEDMDGAGLFSADSGKWHVALTKYLFSIQN